MIRLPLDLDYELLQEGRKALPSSISLAQDVGTPDAHVWKRERQGPAMLRTQPSVVLKGATASLLVASHDSHLLVFMPFRGHLSLTRGSAYDQ